MNKVFCSLFLLFILVGCQTVKEHTDYVKACIEDPVCLDQAKESAKEGREIGTVVGASIPLPGGAAIGALAGYGIMLLWSLIKGGKKKNEETITPQ